MSDNPLKGHMRREKLFIKLPSDGNFYTDEDVSFVKTTNEIGIKSMTAADELSLSTPDALLNGESVSAVLQSCCESIHNPSVLTTADIDVILIGIKIASYGEILEATITCPKCENEMEYEISLPNILSNISYNEATYPVALAKDLTVYLKPNTFASIINLSLKSIEAANILKQFSDSDRDDMEKAIKYTQEFKKIANLNIDIILDGIDHIEIIQNNETVTIDELDYISEWLIECNKETVDIIKGRLAKINDIGIDKSMTFNCDNEECKHEWESEVDLNPITFFTEGF